MPASISSRIISSELLAGPMVQTIFARRVVACLKGSIVPFACLENRETWVEQF